MEPLPDIAVIIDKRRIELGVTVQQLGLEANIPLTTLQRRLAGDGKLTVTELKALAEVLAVKPSEWLEVAA